MIAEAKITNIYFEDNLDDNYIMLSFADDQESPENFLILQNALTYDEQDIALSLDGTYLETNLGNLCGYKLINSVSLKNNQIIFYLNKEKLNSIELIILDLDINQNDLLILKKNMPRLISNFTTQM
jgi:hypothetical protein